MVVAMRARAAMLLAVCLGCGSPQPGRIGALYGKQNVILAAVRHGGLVTDSVAPGVPQLLFPPNNRGEEIGAVLDVVRSLSSDPAVSVVVGPPGSRGAIYAATLLGEAKLPHIVPNATARRLAESGEWTFRLAPDDGVQGRMIARFAVDSLRARNVAIVHVSDEYGVGMRDAVAEGLADHGRTFVDEVVLESFGMYCNAPHVHESIGAIASALIARANPDVIVLAVRSSVAPCLIEMLLDGHPGIRIVASDAIEATDPNLRALPLAIRERIFTVVMWEPGTDEQARAFVALANEVFNRAPSPAEALVYDAFAIAAAAVRAEGSDRKAVRKWIESLGRSRPAWPGVTGPVSFVPGARDSILRIRRMQ
jgi:branched-chain amino acid transport system substrate-binding protein